MTCHTAAGLVGMSTGRADAMSGYMGDVVSEVGGAGQWSVLGVGAGPSPCVKEIEYSAKRKGQNDKGPEHDLKEECVAGGRTSRRWRSRMS